MQTIIYILVILGFLLVLRLLLMGGRLIAEIKQIRAKMDNITTHFADSRPYTQPEEATKGAGTEEKRMTKSLLRRTLTNMGCKVEENENNLWTEYQGENLVFYCNEDDVWVRIVDYTWHTQGLDDLTELSCLKSAINRTNMRSDCTIVYAIDKEDSEVLVHSSKEIAFIKEIPALEDYLRSQFNELLVLHRWLFEDMNEVRKENA